MPADPAWCCHCYWCCRQSAWPGAGLVTLQVAVLPCGSCQEYMCHPNHLLLPSGLGYSYLLLTHWVHGIQERRAGLQQGEIKAPWGVTALSSHTAGSGRLRHHHPWCSAMESLWIYGFCSWKQSRKVGLKEHLNRVSPETWDLQLRAPALCCLPTKTRKLVSV